MGRGINGRSIEICTDGVQHEPKRLSTPVERRRENKQTIWIGAGQIDRGPVYAVESPLQRNVSSAQRAADHGPIDARNGGREEGQTLYIYEYGTRADQADPEDMQFIQSVSADVRPGIR